MGSLTVYANWAPVFHKQGTVQNSWTKVLIKNVQTWYSSIMVSKL